MAHSTTFPEAVFDPQALEAATGGDPDLAREILDIFIEGLPAMIAKTLDAARAGDAAALRMAAHAIKGSAASVGARQLAALVDNIETAARDGHIPAGPLASLETASQAFMQAARIFSEGK